MSEADVNTSVAAPPSSPEPESNDFTVAPQDENENPDPGTTPKAAKAKKSPAKPATPASSKVSYIKLVEDAIAAMKDRTGSSKIAIEKYIVANQPDIDITKLKQRMNTTLKTGVANKRLLKVKASYKIHPSSKKTSKSKAKAKAAKKKEEKKKLTKAELAAIREKERLAAKEKERQDRIRKRKFPMDDLQLIAEDKELKVHVKLGARPSLRLVIPKFSGANKSDTMGSGLLDDIFHIYHFFRGDLGWGRFPKQRKIVAPFSLDHLIECVQEVLRGGAKKTRMLPPLLTHLFVVALQYLVPEELQTGLTPSSWSEILMMYMDAMERYYTTEASEDKNAQPGLPIDIDYLLQISDEPKDESMLEPVLERTSGFYLHGSLEKIHKKLFTHDPWMLSVEELCTLLKHLVDDMMASLPECSDVLDDRLVEVHELAKQKREDDAAFRKVQNLRAKEQKEEKQSEENDGEKKTRSNTKLPSVSEAQIESARRVQQRATDAYEKACRSARVRTEPIGEDRNFHAAYHFWNDPEKVFFLHRGKAMPSSTGSVKVDGLETYRTLWHCIDKRSDLEKYIESLDVRGKRECGLCEGLQPVLKTIHDDIKEMNDRKKRLSELKDLMRKLENAKMKCEVGRKSGRLAAQSEQELSLLQLDIDNLERTIVDEKAPKVISMEEETGLKMLRNFDDQENEHQRRRATRRDTQREQEEGEENNLRRFRCSRMWSTGTIDGTGVLGAVVKELLELEERLQKLSSWEVVGRRSWIGSLEAILHAWHVASPPKFEAFPTVSPIGSPVLGRSPTNKQDGSMDSPVGVGSTDSNGTTSLSVAQALAMLKQPILEIESRIFEVSGLAMAARDADEADENMSSNEEDNKEEELQLLWKKIVFRLHRLQAKAHSKIRQLVVDAIAAARKAHQPLVVQQLRDALLQFHPEAAGACKSAALNILEQHGGYDDFDDDDDDDEDPGDDDDEMLEEPSEISGISSVLCAEAVILNSSLEGQEDASRSDWITAVKKAKTISKIAALVSAFCSKASKKLAKLELENERLTEALESWEKASSLRKKSDIEEQQGPSEVWANVTFTDEFCLVRVEDYPLWPAKKCLPKSEDLESALDKYGRALVSLVGESGGLRVVKKDKVFPFSETLPDDEDLSEHSKEMRNQLEDCMVMSRRIIRGIEKKASLKKKSKGGCHEIKEEKKLAT